MCTHSPRTRIVNDIEVAVGAGLDVRDAARAGADGGEEGVRVLEVRQAVVALFVSLYVCGV